MARIHLSRLETIFGGIGATVTLAFIGTWLYSLSHPLPEVLQGIDATVVIALVAALITLVTYLTNRHYRRRSLRLSVSQELRLSVKQLASFTYHLYSEDEIELDYSTFPDNILEAQLADLGQLSEAEINYLSDYYSLAQIFQSQLSEIQKQDEMSTKDIHESLSGTNDAPITVELLRLANSSLQALEEDQTFEIDLSHFSDDWDGEPMDIEYDDIIEEKE